MLRRQRPPSVEHLLVSDSETDSDDGFCKKNRKGKKYDRQNQKNKMKGKQEVYNESNKVATPFKRNSDVFWRKKWWSGEAPSWRVRPLNDFSYLNKDHFQNLNFYPFKVMHEDPVVELAREYQKQMKKLAIPRGRLPRETQFVNWRSLAASLKAYFEQPLHYLTLVLCKQWDASRFGSEDEEKPLAKMIILSKAENTIWDVERVHRLCTSHTRLAALWRSDPEYLASVHQVLRNHSSHLHRY